MRRYLILLFLVVLLVGVSTVVSNWVSMRPDSQRIVGLWEMETSLVESRRTVVEFNDQGAGEWKLDDGEGRVKKLNNFHYKVTGNRLVIRGKTADGNEYTTIQEIRALTNDRLVLISSDKSEVSFARKK